MAWFTVMRDNRPERRTDTRSLFSNDPFKAAGNPLPPTHDPYMSVYLCHVMGSHRGGTDSVRRKKSPVSNHAIAL